MTEHHLRTWSTYFEAIRVGLKTFEMRSTNDRNFNAGDTLILEEYDPVINSYTGLVAKYTVGFILSGPKFGIAPGWCCMSLLPAETAYEKSSCEWVQEHYGLDDQDFWNSQCGKSWMFEEGGPEENDMHYCPFCGKHLEWVVPKSETEEP